MTIIIRYLFSSQYCSVFFSTLLLKFFDGKHITMKCRNLNKNMPFLLPTQRNQKAIFKLRQTPIVQSPIT